MIEQVLQELNLPGRYPLLLDLPQQHFISLNDLKLIVASPCPNFIFYRTGILLATGKLQVAGDPYDLPIGRMHYINCLGVPCCYLFEVPHYTITVADTYLAVVRHAHDSYAGVTSSFKSRDLNVFNKGQDAMLVMGNTRRYVDISK